jgi:hypothetical protein
LITWVTAHRTPKSASGVADSTRIAMASEYMGCLVDLENAIAIFWRVRIRRVTMRQVIIMLVETLRRMTDKVDIWILMDGISIGERMASTRDAVIYE